MNNNNSNEVGDLTINEAKFIDPRKLGFPVNTQEQLYKMCRELNKGMMAGQAQQEKNTNPK